MGKRLLSNNVRQQWATESRTPVFKQPKTREIRQTGRQLAAAAEADRGISGSIADMFVFGALMSSGAFGMANQNNNGGSNNADNSSYASAANILADSQNSWNAWIGSGNTSIDNSGSI